MEDGRAVPVSDVRISLVDRSGEPRVTTASDSLGRFLLRPPAPGEYSVEASHLGYAPTRSPLLALSAPTTETAEIEIHLTPRPLGLQGFEVSIDAAPPEFLEAMRLEPHELGRRWIDRSGLEALAVPGRLVRDVLRWQGIAGLSVTEIDPTRNPGPPSLCVTLRRGIGCALTILNGTPISPEEAHALDPRELEAIAVLTPNEATLYFGTGAAGGAVLMWTRGRGR
jgi:hypothetical protein